MKSEKKAKPDAIRVLLITVTDVESVRLNSITVHSPPSTVSQKRRRSS
ncbi:MAG: hypothetical protein M1422_06530 [Candidatus Thermoplasmatota archaeon]|nr:hypothetical protein [Candidatus Sysuiplasma jiujiangense]MCL4317908.1 hypothetical protein [Candidatus Thermoplasmatota archaeon]